MPDQENRRTEWDSLLAQFDNLEGLHIFLLGGFRLAQGGEVFSAESFSLRKACDLVKLLALAPRHRLPREQVMEWLWPDGEPKASLNNLNQALRSARQALGVFQPTVYLHNEAGFLDLVSDDELWVDVEAFEIAISRARRSQDPTLYQAALALFAGELLPEDRYAEWTIQRREILNQAYMKLLLDLANLHASRSAHQLAIETFQRLIVVDPLIEEAYAGLMRCLALSGQRSQALRQYQLLQDQLDKELKAKPDQSTQKLYQQILAGEYPPDSQVQVAAGSPLLPEIPQHNLPQPLTSHTGKEKILPTGTVTFFFTEIESETSYWEHESEWIAEALQVHRLVLRKAIDENGGVVFKIVDDSFQAVFATVLQALNAAIEGQRALQRAEQNKLGEFKVRMSLHTGEAELETGGGEYASSLAKDHAARLMSVARGGQILISKDTADLLKLELPERVTLKDLGEHRMKGSIQLERIFQVVAFDLISDFPPLATLVEHPHNLPVRLTSFIGREKEIEAVCDYILRKDVRLLTVTGVGGTGKTSLVQQAGWKLLGHFKDGVFFIDLTSVQESGQVIRAIAEGLNVHELPGRSLKDVMKDHLSRRSLLLIVDNFERVNQAAGSLVGLLQDAPKVKILVTSREPLRVSPEYRYLLPPMHLPDQHALLAGLQENEAMRLFLERAQFIQPSFRLSPENAEEIAELCRQLDGLPLAIELVVARLRLLNPHQLLHQVSDRLRLLSGDFSDQPARHQTMETSISWSYDLLSEPEQRLFNRLSVFQGSFTLEAVTTVCREERYDVISGMESLLDKNMINRREGSSGPRFWLFEILREFALDRLETSGEHEKIQHSFAEFYVQFHIDNWGRYPILDLERHNLVATFKWMIETADVELLYKFGMCFPIWEKQIEEGKRLIARALAMPSTQAHTVGRFNLLYSASALALFSCDYPAARDYIEEFGIIGQEINYGIYYYPYLMGMVAAGMGDYERAVNLHIESGLDNVDKWHASLYSLQMATYMLCLHNYPLGKEYAMQAADLWNSQWQPNPYVVDCLTILGYIALEESLLDSALENFRQAFQLALECSVQERVGSIFMALGVLTMLNGDLKAAVTWMSLSETIKKATGFAMRIMIGNIQEGHLKDLKSRLTPAEFKLSWDLGQVLTWEQAIEYGKEHLLD